MKKTILILAAASLAFGLMVTGTIDYRVFYQAGRAVLGGGNPYQPDIGFYNPLYVAWAYAPLSLLPFEIAFRIQAGLMFFIYMLALLRLAKRGDHFWLLLSIPFAIVTALHGNLEGIILLGATLPAPIGLWLALVKPQMGIVVAAVMLWQECLTHGWKRAALIFLPIGFILILSISMGMLHSTPADQQWNASLWPMGLIVGIPLTLFALRKRDRSLGLLASAFCAPYLTRITWGATLPALWRIHPLRTVNHDRPTPRPHQWRESQTTSAEPCIAGIPHGLHTRHDL